MEWRSSAAAAGASPHLERARAHPLERAVRTPGRRAWQVRRPCRSRFRWNSSSSPGGVIASISSCISSNGAPGAEQAEARPDARDVRVDRARRASRARTAARTPRSCARPRAATSGSACASGHGSAPRSQSSDSSPSGAVSVIAGRIDLIRADLTFEMPPGRIASSICVDRRVADVLPAREALAQGQVGDVAVAVVGRLRQDGQDQLGDRVPVGLGQRDAVHEPQAGRGSRARAGGWDACQPLRPGHYSSAPHRSHAAPTAATASGSDAATADG